MYKILPVILLLILDTSAALPATDVLLRYSTEAGVVRIVVESGDESFIRRAKVFTSYTLIKVEFPGDFQFSAPGSHELLEYSKKGTSLFMNIKGLRSIKLLRLKSPPRLVIDAFLTETSVEIPPEEDTRPATDQPAMEQPPSPEEDVRKGPLRMVVIDPGHGGYDLGIYTPTYSEKNIVLSVAKSLMGEMAGSGKRVFLTRTHDKYIELSERVMGIRERRPDLLISIHMTSSNHVMIYTSLQKQLRGEERYLLSGRQNPYIERSKELAGLIGDNIAENLNLPVLYRELDLPVLSYMECPAVLIELPAADFFNYSKENVSVLIKSILQGVQQYEKG